MNQTTTLKLFSNIFILRKKGKPEFCNVSKFHFWSKNFMEKSDFDFLNPIFNFFEKKIQDFRIFRQFLPIFPAENSKLLSLFLSQK